MIMQHCIATCELQQLCAIHRKIHPVHLMVTMPLSHGCLARLSGGSGVGDDVMIWVGDSLDRLGLSIKPIE